MKKIKNSTTKWNHYQELCEKMGKQAYKPILDVDTRWNSTYSMLLQALQMREVSFKLDVSWCTS